MGALGATERGGNGQNAEVLEMVAVDKVKVEKENIERGTVLSKKLEQYYEILWGVDC